MGCTMVLCPGDLLDGVEPFSEEAVQRMKAKNVVTILGNHERWVHSQIEGGNSGPRTRASLRHRATRLKCPAGP